MKLIFNNLLISLLICLSACSPLGSYKPEKKGAHEGYDLKVWVDGKPSGPIDVPIFQGMNFFNQVSGPGLWRIEGSISRQPHLRYEMDSEVLGKFVSARALFERAPDSGGAFWDPYYSNLSSETPEFEPGFQVQTSHYQTAEDPAYQSALPPGTYLVRLFVYGAKTWDSQSIFVKIE